MMGRMKDGSALTGLPRETAWSVFNPGQKLASIVETMRRQDHK